MHSQPPCPPAARLHVVDCAIPYIKVPYTEKAAARALSGSGQTEAVLRGLPTQSTHSAAWTALPRSSARPSCPLSWLPFQAPMSSPAQISVYGRPVYTHSFRPSVHPFVHPFVSPLQLSYTPAIQQCSLWYTLPLPQLPRGSPSQLAYTTSLRNPTQQHPRPSRRGHPPLPRLPEPANAGARGPLP